MNRFAPPPDNLRHFALFCENCHQDVGEEFGYDTRLIAYGVSWFFYSAPHEAKAILDELKALKTDTEFHAAQEISTRSDIYMVTEGREREDIAMIIEAI